MPATQRGGRIRRRSSSSSNGAAAAAAAAAVSTDTLAVKEQPREIEPDPPVELPDEQSSEVPEAAASEEVAADPPSPRRGRPRGSKNAPKKPPVDADMAALGRLLMGAKAQDVSVEAYVEGLEADLEAYHRAFGMS